MSRALLTTIICFIAASGISGIPSHFQYAFGAHKSRVKNMKAESLFDSQLQVDLARGAEKGDVKKMRQLIDRGADVNYPGIYSMRPLLWAMINENFTGVRFLLENGANPAVEVNVQTLRLKTR